jgi:hypothetical protein
MSQSQLPTSADPSDLGTCALGDTIGEVGLPLLLSVHSGQLIPHLPVVGENMNVLCVSLHYGFQKLFDFKYIITKQTQKGMQ